MDDGTWSFASLAIKWTIFFWYKYLQDTLIRPTKYIYIFLVFSVADEGKRFGIDDDDGGKGLFMLRAPWNEIRHTHMRPSMWKMKQVSEKPGKSGKRGDIGGEDKVTRMTQKQAAIKYRQDT